MSLLDGFNVVHLLKEDDVVQERMDACYQRFGVAKPWRHPALSWIGFVKDGKVALVLAAYVNPDNSVEITDFYPAPTRDGVRAGYVGLKLLKMLVDYHIIPRWFGGIIWKSKSGQRRAERFFGMEPRTCVYVYDGSNP